MIPGALKFPLDLGEVMIGKQDNEVSFFTFCGENVYTLRDLVFQLIKLYLNIYNISHESSNYWLIREIPKFLDIFLPRNMAKCFQNCNYCVFFSTKLKKLNKLVRKRILEILSEFDADSVISPGFIRKFIKKVCETRL